MQAGRDSQFDHKLDRKRGQFDPALDRERELGLGRDSKRDLGPAPRVLVLASVLGQPHGGVRRHNAELLPRAARLLDRAGGALAVLEGDARIEFELPACVERIPARIPSGPPLARARAEARELERVLVRERTGADGFDLVHSAHLPLPGRLAAPCTLTIHDLRGLDRRLSSLRKRLLTRAALSDACARVQRWITVSETVRAQLVHALDLAPERVHVVPNAADHFTPLPRVAAGERSLVCVGHLEPRKNIELVLRALAQRPSLPPLLLAGAAKGSERERLMHRARALGIEARVTFLGPFADADLPRLYAQAACVVVPSSLEGFGISVPEAQRARVPVCIANTDVLLEIAGANTPCFPADDPVACADAIERASASSESQLERAARDAERFSWQSSAQRMVEVWRACLA